MRGLIAGRLVFRECVTWSNFEHSGDGFKPITPAMNIPRTEIDCLYVNGEEGKPTPEQIIAIRTAILEDKEKKASVRREKTAKKKAVKDTLDRLEKGQLPSEAPLVAPAKVSGKRSHKQEIAV